MRFVRLRTGCIRWRLEDEIDPAESAVLSEDTLCFLSVPVNKTGTSFTKPVHRMVGLRIAEWECARPRASTCPRSKNKRVGTFLFSFRGKRIGPGVPKPAVDSLLCRKANVPELDIQEATSRLIVRAQRWRAASVQRTRKASP